MSFLSLSPDASLHCETTDTGRATASHSVPVAAQAIYFCCTCSGTDGKADLV